MDAVRVLALVGATLVDGTERPPVRDAVVVVQGERIVAVGPRASVAIPPGAETVDLRGRFLIPGEADFGTVEPGRRADLVVLTRDPLARIGDTRAIERVMHHGRWVAASDR